MQIGSQIFTENDSCGEKKTWCKPWRRWLQAALCAKRQRRVTHGCSTGPPQLLSLEDERSTAVLHKLSAAWVPAHQTVVSGICQCGEEEEEPKQHRATTESEVVGWVKEEELGCTLDIIDHQRVIFGRKWTVERYFRLLATTKEELGLRDKPNLIYNCDETGFNTGQSRCKMLAPLGASHVYQQAQGTRDHLAVLACFNATGEDVPPFIIFKKHFPGEGTFLLTPCSHPIIILLHHNNWQVNIKEM